MRDGEAISFTIVFMFFPLGKRFLRSTSGDFTDDTLDRSFFKNVLIAVFYIIRKAEKKSRKV